MEDKEQQPKSEPGRVTHIYEPQNIPSMRISFTDSNGGVELECSDYVIENCANAMNYLIRRYQEMLHNNSKPKPKDPSIG